MGHTSDVTGDSGGSSYPRSAGDSGPSRDRTGERAGDYLGPYRLLGRIGEGGFGVVWVAERREPFVQRVAIKIIKPGMDSHAVVARFEQERQALAVMDHPNVARVLDGGITPPEMGSRPYFVMEFVKGDPITVYCDRATLTIRQRLALFLQVCDAVQHAHSKGIIHRDLKPANILAATPDIHGQAPSPGAPAPAPMLKVIDFGVAKAIGPVLTEKTIVTETGQMIGTPEYMSPEQAEMGRLDIDTRSDVYSLGVVLYELLAGVLPFDPDELRRGGYAGMQRAILEADPPSPSRRLTTLGIHGKADQILRHRRSGFNELKRELKRELEWIPLKAMRKMREERYQTATQLADDVRNYLAGRPLAAAPQSGSYRARKFLRKHRVGVGVAAVVAASLVVATAVSLWFYRQAVRDRDTAVEVERFLIHDLLSMGGSAEGSPGLPARALVDRAAAAMGSRFGDRPAVEGRVRAAVGRAYLTVGEPARAVEQFRGAVRALDEAGLGSGDDRFRAATLLAESLYRQGSAAEAEALLGPAVEARRKVRGDDDALVLEARQQLAGALKHAGRLDEAEAVYTDVLARRRRLEGEHSPAAVKAQYNLALVTLARGQQVRAEDAGKSRALFERALEEMQRVHTAALAGLGPEGDITLWSGAERAAILSRLGRYDEAVAAFKPALAAMKARFGERHWRTLEAEANYGIACARAGAWDAAVGALVEAAAGYREIRGAAYPDTITVQRLLSRAQEQTGDVAGAERTLVQGYEALADAGAEAGRLREQAGALAEYFGRRGDRGAEEQWRRKADPGGQ